ncbi:hypothetical protein [Bilophila sp. 4_1_30]|mgnify:CR=1 FL=1|uniref:hypothetical protein n=1 Tax=Bilophila sp. 4_1_30 TaxID=693988 RepID=UPI000223810A|nr:hypothetical protein [Bilophila sp. 4_1_30]EGW42612.1 hypothetical protein HMPREF0178_00028 [Bilophila sp. 4_1_30]
MALPQLLNRLEEAVPTGFIGMWSGSASTIPTGWALCDGTNGTPNLTDRFILGAGKAYQPGATGGTATATPSVAAGSAKTGVSLTTAAPGGTAGNAGTGIAIWNCALNIWTGAAGTGIGIQGSTLDGNTLPSHQHAQYQPQAFRDAAWSEGGVQFFRDPAWVGAGATGNSWAHGHGVSDPGHAHAVGSSEHSHGITDNGHTHAVTTAAHGHTVTDGGHTHALTAQAMNTLPPYYALCFIMKL